MGLFNPIYWNISNSLSLLSSSSLHLIVDLGTIEIVRGVNATTFWLDRFP